MLGEHRSLVRKLLAAQLAESEYYRRVRPYALAFEQIARNLPETPVHRSEDQHHLAQLLDVAREQEIHLPIPKYQGGLKPELDSRHWRVAWTFGTLVCPDPKSLCAFSLQVNLTLALMLGERDAAPAAFLIGTGAQALGMLAVLAPLAGELAAQGTRLFYGTVGELDPEKIAYWLKQESLSPESHSPESLSPSPAPKLPWPDLFGPVLRLDASDRGPLDRAIGERCSYRFREADVPLPKRNFPIPPEKERLFHSLRSLLRPRRGDDGRWK